MNIVMPTPFNPAASWPEPDMTIAAPDRPAPPVLSDAAFQQAFGSWAEWIDRAAQAKNCPRDYVILSLLSAASALIAGSRRIQVHDDWREVPLIWGMLVGDPSAGKSPALDVVMDPIAKLEKAEALDHAAAHSEWAERAEVAKIVEKDWKNKVAAAVKVGDPGPARPVGADAGEEPILPRIRMSDATVESVAAVMAGTQRAVLLSRDEVAGWLEGMDRYNSGGGDRQFWIEAYGGRQYTVDRKSQRSPQIVDHLSVAVLGGTQPDKLDQLFLNAPDDGLLARFLIAFPDPVPISRPTQSIDYGRINTAFERLRQMPCDEDGEPLVVKFDNDARDLLDRFRGDMRLEEASALGPIKGFIGKLPGMVARLACVLAHLDWAHTPVPGVTPPDHIGENAVDRACFLLAGHFLPHARRAYGSAASPVEIRGAARIAAWLLSERRAKLTVRDMQQKQWPGLEKAKDIEAAFAELERADWLRREREVGTSGRPKTVYAVNPRIY